MLNTSSASLSFNIKSILVGATAAIASLSMALPAVADDFPSRPLNMVVGFGTGGSADRMARMMSGPISEELGVPVQVTNRPGAGTQVASNYVLNVPDDGYTVYASTFAPYLTNSILTGDAEFSVDDFSYINFQWFDLDLIAANKDSGYEDLPSLLEAIREEEGQVRGAVVQGSAGHLMVRLLLDEAGIPQDNLNLVTYNSGGEARSAVAGGQVDFVSISAQGSEGIREFLTPLAIVNDERIEQWDALPINEALAPMNLEVPVLQGSMRGFAVTSEMERQHPERFEKISSAIQSALARKDVQEQLERNEMGGVWVGPERSNELMRENYQVFEKYAHLLN
ncbi:MULTISPECIES: Bug family tripartite tricarboxylate transporter substrate binding protein [Halomonadaceae]|jgi:putative tricarboxylic transport membrane protein|uniref:Bordetella uptake protein n=1 Tax=Halomonas campaniensis TaxID=213554 RepID=A0A246S5L0_9GAMM|nr:MULTISPECIES: tripartite tricarboxylate transporter substrate binding protein [Halomonas]MBS3668605.1 tripartite tricarboxylate transporter substrate binding protein [Halomonas boliviensis]OWV31025.1 Bordetella uptake protein [Halomonas campaniensis]QNU64767.1 tripartite tricarboxylate transporter substrate binding protein [Halomonas titanicae]